MPTRRVLLQTLIAGAMLGWSAAALGAQPLPRDPGRGRYTGLPVPRFVSLRSNRVNLRRGPGIRYPIDWVIERRGLPVQIQREFHNWRMIQLPDGTRGWVFHALVVGQRTVVVQHRPAVLHNAPRQKSRAVAVLQPGVIANLVSPQPTAGGWCQVQVPQATGWLPCAAVWGAPALPRPPAAKPAPAPTPTPTPAPAAADEAPKV